MQPVTPPIQLGDAEKIVKVVDSTTSRLITDEVTLSFECGGGIFAPQDQTSTTGEFQVIQPSNCTTLIATAEADGYLRKSKTLSSKTTYIMLASNVVETKGKINVIVKDTVGNAEPDVVVSAIDEITSLEKATGSTTLAGTFLLQNLNPGLYTISVSSSDGRTKQETGVSVTTGEITTVNITLPTIQEVEAKKIYLKLIEQGTTTPVANAYAFVYENDALIPNTTSNSLGIVEKVVTNPTSSYIVVLTHPEFVTKILDDIPLKNLSDTNAINVPMVRSTMDQPNPTSGQIKATVMDEEFVILENAEVTVYSAAYPRIPLKVPPGRTLEDGTYILQNLAAGDYLVKAMDEDGTVESEFVEAEVVAGQTTDVEIIVVLGLGTVEATVFDDETASEAPVIGAEVEFIDANGSFTVLATCTTDTTGTCESTPIAADRFVYVKALAAGFIPAFAPENVDIVNRNKSNVSIGLIHETSIPNGTGAIDPRFKYFCKDRECDEPESKIQSEDETGVKTYYAKFEILFSQDVLYENPMQNIRLGPDSEIDLPLPNDYKIKLRNVFGPLFTAAPLSSCWNNDPTNPFTEPADCATGMDAKQANIYYPNITGQVIVPVIIEFAVEPGLEDGTRLEIHYMAKADVAGVEEVSPPKLKIFLINEVLCDEVDFAWSFKIQNPDETTTILDTAEDVYNQVEMNQAYPLTYSIYNCSGRTFSNVDITAESTPAGLEAISFNPLGAAIDTGPINAYSEQGFSFPADTEISHTFNIYTTSETETAPLEFVLVSGATNVTETVGFNIESSLNLRVGALSPGKLPSTGTPDLLGRITDALVQTKNIEGAFVVLTIDGGTPMTATTDENGLFSIPNISGIKSTSVILLTVRKAGYSTLEKTIEVGSTATGQNPSLDCVSIVKGTSPDVNLHFVIGGSGTAIQDMFTVVNGCDLPVVALLESELIVNPSEEFTLAPDATKIITVDAETTTNSGFDIAMGEYAVYVKGRYESSDPLAGLVGPLATARIYVTNPNSPFRLANPAQPLDPTEMKSTFNIAGGLDQGLIINEDFVFFEDLRMPRLDTVQSFLPVQDAFNLIYVAETKPGEVVNKQKLDFNRNTLLTTGRLEFDALDSGGYVFVDWVDFFMTDKSHSTGDMHRVWGQTYRDVWTNITAQLPFTEPVIGNLGFVDIDVFYSDGAIYSDELTQEPMWQGQHNVCNRNRDNFGASLGACSVSGYMQGDSVIPYKVGAIANKIALEIVPGSDGNNTWVGGARWSYISTDKSHEGNIEFTIRNNTLTGESFALIEVEDTTGVQFVPGAGTEETGGAVTVDWTLSKSGMASFVQDMVLVNSSITIPDKKILGISLDPNASPVFMVGNSLNNISTALSSDSEKIVTNVYFTPTSTWGGNGEQSNSVLHKYSGGSWSISHDFNFDDAGVEDNLPINPASDMAIIAFENNSGEDVVLENVRIVYQDGETRTVEIGRGTATIPLGQASITFDLPPTGTDLPPGDYDPASIEYFLGDSTDNAVVYFSDTKATTSPDPYGSGAKIIAATTTPGQESLTYKERFHIRLVGEAQNQCLRSSGAPGSTGLGAKPRVLLNWEWDSVAIDTCDSLNNDFVYCDPTQFTVSLIKRLEEMRRMAAEEGTDNDTLFKLREMQTFNVYLIEDAYTDDFRSDFVDFYGTELLLDELTNPEHPWARYLLDNTRLVFDTSAAAIEGDAAEAPDVKFVAAGLHEIYLDLDFDEDQFDFFFTQGDEPADLLANVTVYVSKVSHPSIKNPFYYLPFNGNLGREDDGTFQREDYGIVSAQGSDILAVRVAPGGGTLYTTEMPDGSTGRKSVAGVKEADFDTVNITNRGVIMQVAQDPSQTQIDFSPSAATPVLLEMIPEGVKAEAFYWIRDQVNDIPVSIATFMNLWDGSGSTMKLALGQCVDFDGNPLEYRIPDKASGANDCASSQQGAYGFSYDLVEPNEKLYFETVFYVPADTDDQKIFHLRKACENNSTLYSSDNKKTETLSTPIPLSLGGNSVSVATMEDIFGLVESEHICVSSDAENFSFWWNPQKILSGLDSVKLEINPAWDTALDCKGGLSGGGQ